MKRKHRDEREQQVRGGGATSGAPSQARGAGASAGTSMMSPKDVGTSREVEESLTRSDFLKYVTLVQGSSDALNNDEPPGVKVADFVLGKDDLLGAEFECVVGPSRPRAMLFEDGQVTAESFDPKSAEWARIKAQRKGGNTGLEFLLWFSQRRVFATFYFKNTAKPEGAKAVQCRDSGSVARFSSRKVEGKENTWFVPVVRPVRAATKAELPTDEQMAEALTSFESYKLEAGGEAAGRPR